MLFASRLTAAGICELECNCRGASILDIEACIENCDLPVRVQERGLLGCVSSFNAGENGMQKHLSLDEKSKKLLLNL